MTWWQYAANNPGHMMLYVLIAVIWSGWVVDRVSMHIGRAMRIRVKQVWLERTQ